jgi:hypothetical protein
MSRLTCILLAALASSGCADYRFTVNERVVYNPAPLFQAYDVPDPALHDCIQQHIADASITAAEQLTELNCSHAGVSDLTGLPVFSHLVRLKLSRNAIIDLTPLANMNALQVLYLDENRVRNIMPLRGLPELDYLNLAGNEELVCQQLEFFRRQPSLELVAPAHCPR